MKFLCTLALLFAVPLPCPAKPNIIVIFADDMGYADLGCQRQEPDVRTPHLDRFAKEGVRFTAGYVTAPQCSPSRAGLMMGRYQQRIGIDTIPDIPLPLAEQTIAEMLAKLRTASQAWANQLHPPGPPRVPEDAEENEWYREYFNLNL